MTKRFSRMFLATAFVVAAMSSVFAPAQAQDLPKEIVLKAPGMGPEGIEYDAVGERFLLGSLNEGTIYAVQDDGTFAAFIEDEALAASVGIEIDEAGKRLIVANADPNVFFAPTAEIAAVGIYDLETGEQLHMVDLLPLDESQRRFINDVTVDAEGNAYATDSFAPFIYKITPEGEASIFITDPLFKANFFGLNGIVYHPDNYLIVSVGESRKLYKVSLEEKPTVSEITLTNYAAGLAVDGMILDAENTLYAVSDDKVFRIGSSDDFATATVLGTSDHPASTTVALRGESVYALHAYLGGPDTQYEIVLAAFTDFKE
jgi:sugar lactone lactonase YvrE